jgi:hypothetical protein
MYYLIRESQKTVVILHERVDEMRHVMTNTIFFLCCDGLQELKKIEHLGMTLADDEIIFVNKDI